MLALIAGTGSAGRRLARTLQDHVPGIGFVLVRKDARTDDVSRALDARVVATLPEALASRPSFAVVCTPSALHLDALLPLVDAGLPFYVEKPVVATRDQLDRLSAALDRARFSAPTMTGCNLRFLPSLRKLKSLLDAGAVGRVVRASLQAGQWLPDWRPGRDYRSDYSADPDRGGGVILDLVHELDQARWLLGEFDRVRAVAGKLSPLEIRTEDTALILLSRAGGPAVAVALDYVSRRPVRRYEFVGDGGTLSWDLPEKRLSRADAAGEERIDAGADAFDVAATYPAAMREFVEAVRTGRPTSQDVREGMKSAELALRAKEAADAGR